MARSDSYLSGSYGREISDDQTYVSYADSNFRVQDAYAGGQNGGTKRRKKHFKSPFVVFFIVLLLGVVGVTAAFGLTLVNQAREVKAQAKEVVALVESVPDSILAGDTSGLPATANKVVDLSNQISTTVHGRLWNLATLIPTVGSDIKSVQTLSDTLSDLANNALMPVANSLQGISISDLFSNRRVNVEKLTLLANAVSMAAPVFERSAETVESLPPANLSQVADYIEKVRAPLSKYGGLLSEVSDFIPLLPDVFGAGGQRLYLLIAQNNAELRSDGGLPGSVGFVQVTDGYIEIGNFRSISHWYVENYVGETAEEYEFFEGVDLYRDFAQITFLPEFERVGQLAVEYIDAYWPGTKIDGVVAIDPTFLQALMKITKSSTTVQGVTLDGSTTAEVLTHSVYEWFDGSSVNSSSDSFFALAADACADAVFSNLSKIGLKDLKNLLTGASTTGHFYLWMADEAEQAAVRKLAFSGNLDYDKTTPQLGVYLNDYTWSKIDWYVGCATYVSEPTTNADGSSTYEVTTYVKNYLTSDDADSLPKYIIGPNSNSGKYCNSDAITRMYLFAPYGGTITDVQMSYEGPIVFDEMYSYLGSGTVWGHQGHTVQFHTPAQGRVVITYKVNTTPEATELLTVRQTPMAQSDYGFVNLAWEENTD